MKSLMMSLYSEAIPEQKDVYFRSYLESEISNDAVIDRKIRAFDLFAPWLQPGSTVLEWGCRHAIMSCFIHDHLNGDVRLHGCDISGGNFDRFYRSSGLDFTLLDHPWKLPYDDESFDFVLSNGVLEHVANEYESMKEIYRVLRPRGIFAITFLPNRYSVSENISRIIGRDGHNRLYGPARATYDFIRRGFDVEERGYHQVFPTLMGGKSRLGKAVSNSFYRLNRPLEGVWPINRFSSNLYFILRKAYSM